MERGPRSLVVGLDGWPVLGEGEADADEGVHVAVGQMMDDLTEHPASLTIGRVELGEAQALNGVAQFCWQIGQGDDGADTLIFGDRIGRDELADGIAWVEI